MPRRVLSLILLIIPITVFTACGGDDAEPADAPAPAAESSGESDVQEISNYVLSMDDVERVMQAQRNLTQLMQEHPELEDRISMDADAATLDQMEARLNEVPEVREAVEEAGVDTREYVVIFMTLMQAGMADAVIEMGTSRDSVIAEMEVHPDNLDFIRENKEEITRMQEQVAGNG